MQDDCEDDLGVAGSDAHVPEDEFLRADEDINLDSPFLRDLIAIMPIVGSQRLPASRNNAPVLNASEPNWNF